MMCSAAEAERADMSWWLLGNLLFGGLVAFVVDAATGSGMTLEPSDVHMDMKTGEVMRVTARR